MSTSVKVGTSVPMSCLSKTLKAVFGQVFVVSLRRSVERRESLAAHMADLGIENYSFFDATDADDPIVREWLAEGSVHQYPPCFRCGKLSCGQDDCNNILMKAQVATFLSHYRLWRHIADSQCDGALIVEDDVRFHQWAGRVLVDLEKAVADKNSVIFDPTRRCLLRLGWALNDEHRESGFATTPDIRMSNPCYALTRSGAKLAADQLTKIGTTGDVYLHLQLADKFDSALTVLPPIASELSWSAGTVKSEIHPKDQYLNHLRSEGKVAQAEQYSHQMEQHVAHVSHCKLLLIGHPRCGSKFSADVCNAAGLKVSHESFGKDGVSSWMLAVDANPVPLYSDIRVSSRQRLHCNRLIQYVRNPFTAIPSIMVDDAHSEESREFRRQQILEQTGHDLDEIESPIERAAWSLLYWTRIVEEQNPDLWFQIEKPFKLLKYLRDSGLVRSYINISEIDVSPSNEAKKYKGVVYPKPRLKPVDFADLSDGCRAEIARYCSKYGYAYATPRFREKGLENFGAQALAPIGWFKSLETEMPMTAQGKILPWFTYGAIEFLSKAVHPTDKVFEYGSGWSTIWWANNVESVISVEHNPEWVDKVKPHMPGNVTLQQVHIDAPATDEAENFLANYLGKSPRTDFEYPEERRIARGLEDRRFAAYAWEIARKDEQYDIVVIDGMARRLCTDVAADHCNDAGMIVFDNTNRSDYREAYEHLQSKGYRQINFWGPVPGAFFNSCTSIFLRTLDRIPSADFNASVLGIKES